MSLSGEEKNRSPLSHLGLQDFDARFCASHEHSPSSHALRHDVQPHLQFSCALSRLSRRSVALGWPPLLHSTFTVSSMICGTGMATNCSVTFTVSS